MKFIIHNLYIKTLIRLFSYEYFVFQEIEIIFENSRVFYFKS